MLCGAGSRQFFFPRASLKTGTAKISRAFVVSRQEASGIFSARRTSPKKSALETDPYTQSLLAQNFGQFPQEFVCRIRLGQKGLRAARTG